MWEQVQIGNHHYAVHASVGDDWPAATYWEKPGNFDRRTPIALDESTMHHVMDVSRKLTDA